MIMSFQQLVSGVGIYYALNEPSVRKNEGKMGRHKKLSDQNPNGQSGWVRASLTLTLLRHVPGVRWFRPEIV